MKYRKIQWIYSDGQTQPGCELDLRTYEARYGKCPTPYKVLAEYCNHDEQKEHNP